MNLVFLFVGAIAGVSLRYMLWTHFKLVGGFPVATLLANVFGSFLMGWAYALNQSQVSWMLPAVYVAITVGFLGSLTTFSSYSLETLRLLETHGWQWAGANFMLNNLLCLLSCLLGLKAFAFIK